MSTTYQLIQATRYSGVFTGAAYLVGERTLWTIDAYVSNLSLGGSVDILVETSPTGFTNDFVTLTSFSINADGKYTKSSYPSDDPPTTDFSVIALRNTWIRAKITAIVGTATIQVIATAPFFNKFIDDDLNLLVQELRQWDDSRNRIIDAAEEYVTTFITASPFTGELKLDVSIPDVPLGIKSAIVEEANYQYRREMMLRSGDPRILLEALKLPAHSPEISGILGPYIGSSALVWYGR